MPGSFDLGANTIPIAVLSKQVGVFLYDNVTGPNDNPFTLLPNVRCLSVDIREGPDPRVAQFAYLMDDALDLNLGWPSQFDDVWPIDAQGPYVVQPDDRLVVMGSNPDGSPAYYFDGFAANPQVDLTGSKQYATFEAIGVEVRCYDIPIAGRIQRNGNINSLFDLSGGNDVLTDLATHFNPADSTVGNRGGFIANCVPEGLLTTTKDVPRGSYPVFVQPDVQWTAKTAPSYWDVGQAIVYLLAQYNPEESFVKSQDYQTILNLMLDYYPAEGFDVMNPANPASFVTAPVTIRDYDATNKPWPVAVAELAGYCGYVMRWDLESRASGFPVTRLKFYRRDEFTSSPTRSTYLDAVGSTVGDNVNNVAGMRLKRDTNAMINGFDVEIAPKQVEVSVFLAPLYQPAPGDAAPLSILDFRESNWTDSTSVTNRRKYRWYGVDELGEEHWINTQNPAAWQRSTEPFAYKYDSPIGPNTSLFPPDKDGNPTYVQRRRPGLHTLISQDTDGKPLKATLQIGIGRDQVTSSADPAVANVAQLLKDGTKLIEITRGWRLLDDRLGIVVTEDDPEQWKTGNDQLAIRGITWWANPDPKDALVKGYTPFLILTTVIECDRQPSISADPRLVSPTSFDRYRTLDAKDHFKYTTVDVGSRYYTQDGGNGKDPYVVRDDTDVAKTHAYQMRSAHVPPTAGSLSIPYVTSRYEVGDRVRDVSGRGVTFQTNVGIDQGEAPIYPWIVGVTWAFESDKQSTTLQLSDRRADPRNSW